MSGVRILDLSRVLAGPLATQALAELGADVIKVERPGTGDESRVMEPRLATGESAYYFAVNRTKRSIELDLKAPAGRAVLLDLVRTADVVVENFLPGTLDRMGIGFDELTAANPRIVLVSNTGFGQTGPDAQRKGYDTVFQAMSGVMHLTGHPDGDPAKVGIPVADMTSSLWIVIATLTGLLDRERTGTGGHWDVAMMDVQASLLAISATRLFAYDEDVERTGTEHPGRVPSAAFRCADDRWVHISASDQHWAGLCRALGLDDDAARRWATNTDRTRDREDVMRTLREAFAALPSAEAVDGLLDEGVPAGLVQTPREALATPQAQHRATVQTFEHPSAGTFLAISTPLRRAGDPAPAMSAPPLLGQDTDSVLADLLGRTAEEIRELDASGAFGKKEVNA